MRSSSAGTLRKVENLHECGGVPYHALVPAWGRHKLVCRFQRPHSAKKKRSLPFTRTSFSCSLRLLSCLEARADTRDTT